MKLKDMITLRSNAQVIALNPLSSVHAPSLKNPVKVNENFPGKGWQPGASKQEREQALKDLVETLNRTRRQVGKPGIARTALAPIRPVLEST